MFAPPDIELPGVREDPPKLWPWRIISRSCHKGSHERGRNGQLKPIEKVGRVDREGTTHRDMESQQQLLRRVDLEFVNPAFGCLGLFRP